MRPALELLLADTEGEIARLQQVAIQTRTSINECPPISSLPPETLLEIFVFCCQPEYNAIGGVDGQGICPLRLSAVCKAWRDLAWTTSRLWSVIILIKPNRHASHLEEILASWIERARNHPLSIRYEAKSDSLLRLLAQEKSKWMNVSIFQVDSDFLWLIRDHKYFPLLEHLSIRVRANYLSRFDRDGLDDLGIFNAASLPKITRLHVPKYLPRFKSDLMWSQLRTFSASTIGHEDLCQILRLARFLEVFNANSLKPHPDGSVLQTVNHSYLRCLVLEKVDSDGLNNLLSTPGISTPNLEDLTIEIYDGNPKSTSLSKFITSLHRLRRFKVKYCCDNKSKWVFNWLLNIPSLTELDVEISTSALAKIVSALGKPAPKRTKAEYLPLLVNFAVTVSPRDFRMKDIVEMLAYRSSGLSPSVSRLKSALIFNAHKHFTKEDFETLQTASLGDLVVTMVDPKGTYISIPDSEGNWKSWEMKHNF